MSVLKPCPFCGGKADINRCGNRWQAWCRHCATIQMGEFYDTEADAIAAWNRRVDARQLALKTRVCPMCEDCPDGCPVETPKDSRNIVTNADRIRSMNDEELAEFLRNIRDCGDYEELKFIGGVCMDYVSVIEWLKQPAKEE